MKTKLLIVCCLLLAGCSGDLTKTEENGGEWKVIRVDGCQYLFLHSGYQGYLAHKGDCDNPIHIHNGGNHE